MGVRLSYFAVSLLSSTTSSSMVAKREVRVRLENSPIAALSARGRERLRNEARRCGHILSIASADSNGVDNGNPSLEIN